jgi:hypothetical protein
MKELSKGRTTALTLLHNQGWRKKYCDSDTSGLYYKHSMIVNYASSIINKLKALHNDNARVVIYYRHVQATGPFEPQKIARDKHPDFFSPSFLGVGFKK